MRRALIILAALVVVLVLAVLIGPSLVDWNDYKPDITARVEAETGRKLAIVGDLDLAILPQPALSVEGLRLSNAEGAATTDMVSVASADVVLAFWPLLSGEIQVEKAHLREPTIALEILADGTGNWLFDGGETDAPGSAAVEVPDGPPADEAASFRLDELEVEAGTITFRDAAGRVQRIEQLNAELVAESLDGPFAAVGTLSTEGVLLRFDLSAGATTVESVPIDVALEVGEGAGRLNFTGVLAQHTATGPAASGKIDIEADSAGGLIAATARLAGVDLPALAMLDQPFALSGEIDATGEEAGLNEISLSLGVTAATGAVSAAFAEGLQVDLAVAVKRVDLDQWLALLAQSPGADEGADPAAADADADQSRETVDAFALPADLLGSFNIDIEALTYRGSLVRQVTASGTVADGVATFGRVAALLPGGSDITVGGTLTAVEGQPRFDGQVEAASDNLRALLAWLELDIIDIPADRLRKFGVTSNLRVAPDLLQAYGLDLRLDASRLTGGVAYAIRERTAFSVDLTVDRLNLDAYLPPPIDEAAEDTPEGAEGSAPATEVASTPLAFLNTIDTNVKLRAGEITYNHIPIKGLTIDSSLIGGALTVREARIEDVAGAAVAIAGTANGFSGALHFAGTVEVDAPDPGGLLQLADIAWPVPGDRLGPLSLSAAIEQAADSLTIDVDATAAATKVGLKGRIGALALAAPLDLVLEVANPRVGDLVAQFADAVIGDAPWARGPVSLKADLGGTIASDLDVALSAEVAGAEVVADGVVRPLAGPAYELAFSTTHPDVTKLINDIGFAFSPAAVNLGGLRIAANMSGGTEQVALKAMTVQAGPVVLEGDATVRFAEVRPHVTADLRTSQVLVDLFLPAVGGGGGDSGGGSGGDAAAPAGRERWSREPIDLGALRTVDGDIELAAVAIDYGSYQFGQPSMRLLLDDGVLTIDPLRGTLYDGDLQLRARVVDGEVPEFALSFDLQNADIYQALIANAGIDRVTGRFGMTGDVTSRGRSQYELISGLDGQARFAARNGTLAGINLRALSDRMKELDATADFLRLVQISTSGGQTAYRTIDSIIDIRGGIGRSNDLRALLDAAEGRGVGAVDLPRWLIDLKSELRLTDHPNAPPLGFHLDGPLDSPRQDVKTRELEAFIAQRVGTAVLRKLAPDELKDILPDASGSSQGTGTGDTGSTSQEEQVGKTLEKLLDVFGN